MYMRLLDLFSGTHSVGNVARNLGFEVISLDLNDATITCDVRVWDYVSAFPQGHFDVIWASPPCQTFSCVRRTNINRNGYTHESLERDMMEEGVPILHKTMEIITHFQPKYYFIENPDSGLMKRFINDRPYYVVDYCMYGFPYRKRTRIWTNLGDFQPKLCNKNCGAYVGNKHILNAVGGTKSQKGQGSGSNRNARYKIPAPLIQELLSLATINADLQLP